MQNQILGFFVITCVALGILCGLQWKQLRRQNAQITQLEEDLGDQTVHIDGQRAALDSLEKERAELGQDLHKSLDTIQSLQLETNRLQEALALLSSKDDWHTLSHPIYTLFRDEDRRLRELLGEERYALYEEFLRIMGGQNLLQKLSQELEAEESLKPKQLDLLLAALKQKSRDLAQQPEPLTSSPDPLWMGHLARTEILHQHLLQEAKAILSPAQWKMLAQLQTQWLQQENLRFQSLPPSQSDGEGD